MSHKTSLMSHNQTSRNLCLLFIACNQFRL